MEEKRKNIFEFILLILKNKYILIILINIISFFIGIKLILNFVIICSELFVFYNMIRKIFSTNIFDTLNIFANNISLYFLKNKITIKDNINTEFTSELHKTVEILKVKYLNLFKIYYYIYYISLTLLFHTFLNSLLIYNMFLSDNNILKTIYDNNPVKFYDILLLVFNSIISSDKNTIIPTSFNLNLLLSLNSFVFIFISVFVLFYISTKQDANLELYDNFSNESNNNNENQYVKKIKEFNFNLLNHGFLKAIKKLKIKKE